MGMRTISRDIKIAAINLHEHGVLSIEEICDCVGFSRATFYRVLKLWRTIGDVVAQRTGVTLGRPRDFDFDDINYLLRLIEFRPDWFLDELLNLLRTNRLIAANLSTIFRALERAGVSSKKIKKIAMERDEPLRYDFVRKMARYAPQQLGFIDETSKNDRTPARLRG
jgi:transposase